MTAQLPPIPPASRPKKGPGADGHVPKPHDPEHHAQNTNTNEQGEAGNVHQNTTNQGYQQDR